jgi:hypothetical protein
MLNGLNNGIKKITSILNIIILFRLNNNKEESTPKPIYKIKCIISKKHYNKKIIKPNIYLKL